MSAPVLRPYQIDFIEEFNRLVAAGERRIIGVAPTGANLATVRQHQDILAGARHHADDLGEDHGLARYMALSRTLLPGRSILIATQSVRYTKSAASNTPRV